MKSKVITGLVLTLFLIGMLTLAFNIQPVKASGTICIMADGSIEPPTVNITTVDKVTYTLTGNIYDSIVVERDNIVIDGAGYTVQGTGAYPSKGINLTERKNVTIKNVEVKAFDYGIFLDQSLNNRIIGTNLTKNDYGIYLYHSSNNTISANHIYNNSRGIYLYIDSENNTISANYIYNNSEDGIDLRPSSNNTISANHIYNNSRGIYLYIDSENNTISANYIYNNSEDGIYLYHCSNNHISANHIYNNSEDGICLYHCSNNNTISANYIYNNSRYGIYLYYYSKNNILRNNVLANNRYNFCVEGYLWEYEAYHQDIDASNTINGKPIYYIVGQSNLVFDSIEIGYLGLVSCNNVVVKNLTLTDNGQGLLLVDTSYTTISANNIYNNHYGIYLYYSSTNTIYHNNFINNTNQVYSYYSHLNFLDDGYPTGGNYWSNYTGVDLFSGPYQNITGTDGIGDTPYVIDADNRDRYPLMNPWTPPEYELVVSITAPASLQLGGSSSLNATVTNQGLRDEANVELLLLINGIIVNSTTIPLLKVGNSYTLTYLWSPTVEGTYNVTGYVPPAPDESSVENNQMSKFVTVVRIGVKAGDWIKYDYTVTGAPAGTLLPTWLKVEFLSVEGTNATVRVTMHMSDGTEPSQTMTVDVAAGGGTFDIFSGFIIPANSKVGDSIYISGYGNITIAGETTRTYAGASRTVVYASISQYGTQLTYYWDKQTGVLVEASGTSDGMTLTAKATETNMWEAAPPTPFWMQWWLWAIVIAAIVALAGAVYFLKKRKPPTPTTPTPPTEGTL